MTEGKNYTLDMKKKTIKYFLKYYFIYTNLQNISLIENQLFFSISFFINTTISGEQISSKFTMFKSLHLQQIKENFS